MGAVRDYFLGLQNHCRWWLQPWNSKTLAPWKKSHDQPRQCIKKQRHYFADKGPSSQSHGFPNCHVWMWELDYKESRALKNWCFWTVVLEKTLESPLDSKEIQPVHPELNQSWIFIGRTDVEAEAPVLCLPDAKNWLIGKDPDAGKDWRLEEKGMTGWDGWMASLTQWTWVWVNSGSRWWTEGPGVLHAVHGVAESRARLSDWTELSDLFRKLFECWEACHSDRYKFSAILIFVLKFKFFHWLQYC